MSPEVVQYCKRAIIDYLAGNIGEFERLVSLAMEIYKRQENVCECGNLLIKGKLRHDKEKIDVQVCTNCGQVYKNGEKLMKVRGKRIC